MRKHWLVLLISAFTVLGCEDNASGGDGAQPNDARKDPVVSISLSTEPASRVFPLNTEIQFRWIATLQSGQTIEQPPANLDIPPD